MSSTKFCQLIKKLLVNDMRLREVIFFSIGPLGLGILGLAIYQILAWNFSVDDIGRLGLLQVSISFLVLCMSFGLDQSYIREFHEAEDRYALLKNTVYPGIIILACILVFVSVIKFNFASRLFELRSVLLEVTFLSLLVVNLLSVYINLNLRMNGRSFLYSLFQLLPKVLFLLIVCVGVMSGNFSANFVNLALLLLCSILLVFFPFGFITRSYWLPIFSVDFDFSQFKKMAVYAMPLFISGLAFWGITASDRFFLKEYSSYSEVGIYSMAISLAGAGMILQAIFSTVWAPIVYKWVSNESDEAEKKISEVVSYLVLAVVVLWCLLALTSGVVTYILPVEYGKVEFLVIALVAYPLLYTVSEVTGIGINIKRKTRYSLYAALSALTINLAGNFFLVPNYGASGAAIASVMAMAVFLLLKTYYSRVLYGEVISRFQMFSLLFLSFLSMAINFTDGHKASAISIRAVFLCLLVVTVVNYRYLVKEMIGYVFKVN